MFFQRGAQLRKRFVVDPEQQLCARWRGEDFIEEDLEGGIRHGFESERRLAHFADALAQGADVLGAVMRVQRKGHLQFVNRLGREARDVNAVQPLKRVVKALEAAHAFLDGKAGLLRVIESRQPGERRKSVE